MAPVWPPLTAEKSLTRPWVLLPARFGHGYPLRRYRPGHCVLHHGETQHGSGGDQQLPEQEIRRPWFVRCQQRLPGYDEAAAAGNERAKLTLDVYCTRVKAYIGAYAALLNGLDAIVFTAGLGENAISIRECIASDLEFLGIKMDKAKNKVRGKEVDVSTEDSRSASLLSRPMKNWLLPETHTILPSSL